MVKGLRISNQEGPPSTVAKLSTTLELLARHGAIEITRQRIGRGKIFYLDAVSEWQGFEFIYLLSGSLALKDKTKNTEILLQPGEYLHHRGLPEQVYFYVKEDVELLMVASPPSFHLMREEIQGMMALARSVEEKDPATEGHCDRLERLALLAGEQLRLAEDRLMALSYAAYLHDIGKVKIPDHILNKPGPLTDQEWEEMRKHPGYGVQMLAGKEFLSDAAEIVLAHHERYDGRGYPRELAHDAIPIEARIIAVVDSYDAMVSDRPYREALSKTAALAELRKNAGSQFDPQVVDAFLLVIGASGGELDVA